MRDEKRRKEGEMRREQEKKGRKVKNKVRKVKKKVMKIIKSEKRRGWSGNDKGKNLDHCCVFINHEGEIF